MSRRRHFLLIGRVHSLGLKLVELTVKAQKLILVVVSTLSRFRPL